MIAPPSATSYAVLCFGREGHNTMSDPSPFTMLSRQSWRLPIFALAAILALFAIAFGFYFYRAKTPDPMLQAVIDAIHHDAMAQTALGQDIVMTGLPTMQYCHDASGEIGRFMLSVTGNCGKGDARAAVFVAKGQTAPDIKSIALTAPDGSNSDIVGSAADESWLEEPHRSDDTCRHVRSE